MYRRLLELVLVCISLAQWGWTQEVRIWNRTVQAHGFVSQGFVYTNQNNWLTMNTTAGSGAMTEMGLNVSSQITDKFRVGAQVYDRNLGQLGQWHPSLDWAVADYRFTSWLGIRAGKVKTTLGLYNDSQDVDFLRVFALLPQSVYPTDLRDATIAHSGGDIYGNFTLRHRLGELSYTAYAGYRNDSIYSGYPYLISQWGTHLRGLGGLQYGADLRWNTPLRGLLVGASRMNQDISGKGTGFVRLFDPAAGIGPYYEFSKANWTNQFYGQYGIRRLQIDAEYRRYLRDQVILNGTSENITDVRGWYVSGTYRISKRWKVGSYYSHYTVTDAFGGLLATFTPDQTDTSRPENHLYDTAVTAAVDLNRFWDVKVEGHFMNGFANAMYPDGFYPQQNRQGFKPNTNALVIKTGFHF